MWSLFVLVFMIILLLVAAILPPGISVLSFLGVNFFTGILGVICFIFFIKKIIKKKPFIWYLISIIPITVYFIFCNELHNYVHGWNEVKSH